MIISDLTAVPNGRYEIILADPPWSYDQGGRGAAKNHYDNSMGLEAICDLPVGRLAHRNAFLFLWATPPNIAGGARLGLLRASSGRMTPYYARDGITLFLGDTLDVLEAGVVPDCIDNLLGDPPYSSGGRQAAGARQTFEKSRRADWFLGDNMGADSYRWWMREFGRLVYGKIAVGGHAYLFTDWRQYPTLLEAIETRGFTARSVITWDKNRGGALGSFWRSNHEWIVVFTKGPARGVARHDGFNTWTGSKPQGGEHPTEKPLGLLDYILQVAGGQSVLDPWVGSGTTLIAAKRLGMTGYGIDNNERFLEMAAEALDRTLPLERQPADGVLPLAFDAPAAI